MKKLISGILVLFMITLVFPLSAFAENTSGVLDSGVCGADGDNVIWTLYKNGELVISGEGKMQDFYYDCTWEPYKNSIKNVLVEEGVENIGNNAFRGLHYVENFSISDSVTAIGEYAFAWTAFGYKYSVYREIKLPDSVTDIAEKAFYGSYIDRIVIPENVTVIKKDTFSDCHKLDCVVLSANVTEVEDNAFGGCEETDTVYFKGSREQWNSIAFNSGNGYLKSADNIHFDVICHDYEESIVAPTCTEKGYTVYTCKICGDEYIDENSYEDITAHSTTNGQCEMCEKFFVEVGETVALSVTTDKQTEIEWKLAENNASITGTSTSSVIMGSFIRITESVDIKGITEGVNILTATENGQVISTAEIEILTHTHKYSVSSVTAPTCTEKGFTEYSCPCGDSYIDDYTDITEHGYMPIITEPTCTEKGFTTYLCSCGDEYIADYTEPLGHVCGWLTVAEPQTGIEGLEQYQCALCEEVFEERAIPALKMPGDINGDGRINAADARLALRAASRLETLSDDAFFTADVDGNGKVNAADARIILRVASKLETF